MLTPLLPEDAEAVVQLQFTAFADLDRRMGRPVHDPPTDLTGPHERVRHLATTDAGGAWKWVEPDGTISGASLALVREGVWGLSLLVVRPGLQSGGRGRDLLTAALAHGDGVRGGIILASEDPRALRSYWKAGYRLLPAFDAAGVVVRPPRPPHGVRELRWPEDRELVDDTARAVRGAAYGPDADVLARVCTRAFVHDDGGFVFVNENTIRCIGARRAEVAADLLRTALRATPPDAEAALSFIEGNQDWAFDVVLEAGLELRAGGAVAVRGDLGPMRPYVPSGAYL